MEFSSLTILLLIIIAAVMAVCCVPLVLYLGIKMGTYAFYRGRQIFLDDQNKREEG